MNLLAHAYLSFNQPGILTGNMISDFIKGKKKFAYPPIVQQGIALHRAIDDFTDFHPSTREAKKHFQPQYRLYAGAFVDVVYDHFLANDPNEFAQKTVLENFCQQTYQMLRVDSINLPLPFAEMLPYMEQQNWLYHYSFRSGIEKSFGGLVRRARYLTESAIAYEVFNMHYEALKECYEEFFPDVKKMASEYLGAINNS